MKKLLLIIAVFISLGISSCKAQDYIDFIKTEQTFETIKYGYLYNWYAATDSRNITSSNDWIVPEQTDYNTLSTYLSSNIGGKMKETGTTYWDSPNTNATNESGFNGRGAGERLFNTGAFSNIKIFCYFWTKTDPAGTPTCKYDRLDNTTGDFSNYDGTDLAKLKGLSIRLLYTGSGTPTSYTGNDGKVYRVVTIGTQIWLADNLAETKYRNGDTITVVTDNTSWAGLTTGARCVYNNDESNK
jgi:uncharacterized protein (TIGR02145 family)